MAEQITAEQVSYKITKDAIAKQIDENCWTNPFFIAEYILGTDIWNSLPEWDKKILVARVHKIATEDEHLRKKYFS